MAERVRAREKPAVPSGPLANRCCCCGGPPLAAIDALARRKSARIGGRTSVADGSRIKAGSLLLFRDFLSGVSFSSPSSPPLLPLLSGCAPLEPRRRLADGRAGEFGIELSPPGEGEGLVVGDRLGPRLGLGCWREPELRLSLLIILLYSPMLKILYSASRLSINSSIGDGTVAVAAAAAGVDDGTGLALGLGGTTAAPAAPAAFAAGTGVEMDAELIIAINMGEADDDDAAAAAALLLLMGVSVKVVTVGAGDSFPSPGAGEGEVEVRLKEGSGVRGTKGVARGESLGEGFALRGMRRGEGDAPGAGEPLVAAAEVSGLLGSIKGLMRGVGVLSPTGAGEAAAEADAAAAASACLAFLFFTCR